MTTSDDPRYLFREDADALREWEMAQWREWFARGAEGFNLVKAAVLAPPGPERDAALAAYSAAVVTKSAALTAAASSKRDGLAVRGTELVARANELGRLAVQAYANDDYRHDRALRAILADVAALPEPLRNAVRLDDYVWDRMVGWESDRSECTRGEITLAELDGVDEVDRLWSVLRRGAAR